MSAFHPLQTSASITRDPGEALELIRDAQEKRCFGTSKIVQGLAATSHRFRAKRNGSIWFSAS